MLTYESAAKTQLPPIDYIFVEKSKRVLIVYQGDKLIKTYKIALGPNTKGHKEKEGDCKTPKGIYSIAAKNPYSQYHKSLKLSYPNKKDQQHAAKLGCSPGGYIMIHGLGKSFSWLGKGHYLRDWTLGCIAVTNEEIDEIYSSVAVGTKIKIKP